MAEIFAEREGSDGLRGQLDHVLVDVPGLVVGVQLVEHGKRLSCAVLHQACVVSYRFGPHGWWEVFVGETPVFSLCVTDEDGGVVFYAPERVILVDLLGHVG